ncbi:MAG: hypothetical protein ACLFUQ_04835 [Candidatus Izemoplasmataceae bacterium]
MKKLVALIAMLVFSVTLAGCDIIEEEIERAESIELEDYSVNIPDQSVLLKITSDADEQVIEEVDVNGERYELKSEGDDWYLLEDVPIEKSYDIDEVYYKTGVGARVDFDVDYDITLDEAIERAPDGLLTELDDSHTLGEYRFEASDEDLAKVDSENDFTKEALDDWAFVILEDDVPLYAVFEHEDTVYIVEAPDNVEEYIE